MDHVPEHHKNIYCHDHHHHEKNINASNNLLHSIFSSSFPPIPSVVSMMTRSKGYDHHFVIILMMITTIHIFIKNDMMCAYLLQNHILSCKLPSSFHVERRGSSSSRPPFLLGYQQQINIHIFGDYREIF